MKTINIDHKFCVSDSQAERLAANVARFPIRELDKSREKYGDYAHQISEIYKKCMDGWKYETPQAILGAVGRKYHHILVAMDDGKAVGTVRSVLLPNANMVYGSCLAVEESHRGQGIAIPLIIAAMSVANEDSLDLGKGGITGAFLGVDNDAGMRRLHSAWGVKFIHHEDVPFIIMPFEGIDRKIQIRSFGIRKLEDSKAISKRELEDMVADLTAFEIEVGYIEQDVFARDRIYANILADRNEIPFFSSNEYGEVTMKANLASGVSVLMKTLVPGEEKFGNPRRIM